MVAITNYNTLLEAVSSTAEDDSVEFLDYIPTAIGLAHDMLVREMDLSDLEKTVTGNLTMSVGNVPKPSDFRFADYFYILVSNKKILLRQRQKDFLIDYWPNDSVTAVPKYYSDISKTEFKVAPTPNSAYGYELRYTGAVDMISTSVATNYFTERCPYILFYAVMAEMARFMKAWSQVQFWEQKYVDGRDAWNIEMSRKRRDSGETPNYPQGPNTLKHTITTNA